MNHNTLLSFMILFTLAARAQENPTKDGNKTQTAQTTTIDSSVADASPTSYKPAELYDRITSDQKTKSKLLREYSFVDFYAIKDLKRVICDSLTTARKELAYIQLKNALNKNEDANTAAPTNTNNSVSVTSTTTNSDSMPAKQTTAATTPSTNTVNVNLRLLQIQRLAQDSTDLANCFIGGQNFYMGTIAGFQNFADLPDDNPQQITQFNFNYSLPLKKLNGKMVCNYRKPYTFVWFRNLYFTSLLTPVTVASKLFYANGLDTTFNGKQSVYANYLDLTQFSRLKAHLNLNVLTFVSRYYSVYGNLHGGIGRCEVKYGEKSNQVNYYDYGLNLALRTKFNIPLNLVATYHLYLLDANSDLITPNLNRQYANLYKSGEAYFRQSTKNSQFNTFNLTFQYDLRALSSTNDPGTGNSNSSSPTFLYASIGYSTNRMVGPRYNQQAHNNFLTIQLGYSRNFDEIAKAVKSILGLKTEGNSAAAQ